VLEAQLHNLFCLMVRTEQGLIIELCEITPGFCIFGGGQLNSLLIVNYTKGLRYFALANARAISLRYRDAESEHL
jgi:hypothetical protein